MKCSRIANDETLSRVQNQRHQDIQKLSRVQLANNETLLRIEILLISVANKYIGYLIKNWCVWKET